MGVSWCRGPPVVALHLVSGATHRFSTCGHAFRRETERRRPESNRCTRLCRPLRSHSATAPGWAGDLSRCYPSRTPGRLAQLGERRLDKAEVTGSSPVSPTYEAPLRGAFPFVAPSSASG